MSSTITDQLAQDKLARITGGLYLSFILASVLADMLGHIGLGDAQQIAQAISTNAWSFRLGLVIAFLSAFLFLVTAWGLYVLLRSVNADVALLFLLLNTVGVAIQCASMLPLIFAMLLGDGASSMHSWRGWRTCRSTSIKPASSPPSCSSARGCSRSAIWSTSPRSFHGSWACCCCLTESGS